MGRVKSVTKKGLSDAANVHTACVVNTLNVTHAAAKAKSLKECTQFILATSLPILYRMAKKWEEESKSFGDLTCGMVLPFRIHLFYLVTTESFVSS